TAVQFFDDLTPPPYKEGRDSFTIPRGGELVLVNRKARMGRNPATGGGNKNPPQRAGEVPASKKAKDAILAAKKEPALSNGNKKAVPRDRLFSCRRDDLLHLGLGLGLGDRDLARERGAVVRVGAHRDRLPDRQILRELRFIRDRVPHGLVIGPLDGEELAGLIGRDRPLDGRRGGLHGVAAGARLGPLGR